MGKVMKCAPLADLFGRVAGEYAEAGSIFGIGRDSFEEAFALEARSPGLAVMGGRASLPLGPAAGPHSQISSCLVAAYLAGARVFELKTVQDNDALDIAKPCIEALDEGHNVEWSTELSIGEARDEYLRGWIAINLLASIFSAKPRDFFFNVSAGYTLEGIRGPKVDAYLEGMRKPSTLPSWGRWIDQTAAFIESAKFQSAFGGVRGAVERARMLVRAMPDAPTHSVTLSTMHGCPPAEIERIGSYLIEQKNFDVYVKLNPTLLGYEEARAILDRCGWRRIELRRESFEHDLQFEDALGLIASLRAKARAAGRRFGIKLSNTLANRNTGSFLPGEERYMSGRALFPITARLAAKLAKALPDFDAPFSYCGGVSALNATELVKAGMGPLTVATELLKPGGYQRLLPMARAATLGLVGGSGMPARPDARALEELAEAALSRPEYQCGWKEGAARIHKKLPLFDCFAAPCIEACPVRQKAPTYIRMSASGATAEALDLILADNPLPFITGTLCDHVCQEACCRNDYEGPVRIRDCKLAAAKSARIPVNKAAPADFKGRVAVIGAGPAGLSCAHFLALAGIPVTVFEKDKEPGGVPANVIPRFRIPREDIAKDIQRIKDLGVEFRFGSEVEGLSSLEKEGYSAFFAAPGAPVAKKLRLEGSGLEVVDALEFLTNTARYAGRGRIVVTGGGNTAMDAVRAASRLEGVRSIRLSYRRGRAEIPADKEELGNAMAEASALNARGGESGQVLMELSLPERMLPAAAKTESPRLVLRTMKLGEPDASGRRRPLPSEQTETLDCDLLVAAIGEEADRRLLTSLGAALGDDGRPSVDPETQESSRPGLYLGGDASRGPASIIAAAADGRRAAFAIMRKAGIRPPERHYSPAAADSKKIAERGSILMSLKPSEKNFVHREAERCLACDSACLRCVEVCPNRANLSLAVFGDGTFAQSSQILHVDALCNECGNCGLFCPYEGEPYRHKPTLFDSEGELRASENPGFAFAAEGCLVMRPERGDQPLVLKRDQWRKSADQGCLMESLARCVLDCHGYLLGAGQGGNR